MTKMDEAASTGGVLDIVIRQKLKLHYVSNGQRVPEDLHVADSAMLIDRAFRNRGVAPLDADLPMLMAATAQATRREVSHG